MARCGLSLVLLALAAHRVTAEPSPPAAGPSAAFVAPVAPAPPTEAPHRSPVEVTAEVHVRSLGNVFADDAALDGKGPGASVRAGYSWLHLQASWDYVQEVVGDPFEDVRYDEHAHQFLVGPAFVWHIGSRVSASGAFGLALSYYNGRRAPELKQGAWTDVRFDVDVFEFAPGQRIAIIVSGSLVATTPGGIAGTIGVGYHLR